VISLNEIRKRSRSFSHEWKREYNEDAEAKSFWDGFFDVFGVSRRRVASFESPVKKLGGSQGFIDVLWKGVLLAEHKSRGKNLDKAFAQAKDYFPGLPDTALPRYIIVSDFARIRLYDIETGEQHEFPLSELHSNIHLFDFISGYTSTNYEKEEEVSVEAARLMADFHNEIAKTGYAGHDLEVFLIRILFCLFAEDTGIFSKGHFRWYIENRTHGDGSDLGIHLLEIFDVLNTSRERRQTTLDESLNKFPYVNGGIFEERIRPVSLDATARLKLLKCCGFDWSGISASIFGSLFQAVMEEDQRRQLGAHYTSELNILKVIKPLFLDELYIEFDQAKYDKRRLEAFHKKLAQLTFLDPACGCGNFLVVAYRELRKLELEVLLIKRGAGKTMTLLGTEELSLINVSQFYGIEFEEFPVLVARVAMYLVDHQMNNALSEKFGLVYARLPLRAPASIVHADALMTDWESVVPKRRLSFILGNPPFVGARLMTEDQKKAFIALFENMRGAGNLDFVTGWYEKASRYMEGTDIKTAFVSTNSISQGEQVGLLWRRLTEKYGVVIQFAHQTFKWNNDAPGLAAVYCVIVGFACFDIPKKYLFEYETVKSEPREQEVEHISPYLVAGADVFVDSRSKPICDVPEIGIGNKPIDGGYYLFTPEERDEFLAHEPGAAQFMRRWLGADEFLNGYERWCLWLGAAKPEELRALPLVMERIDAVRNYRLVSTSAPTRKLAATPTRFHVENIPSSPYLLIPSVSSERREYIPLGFIEPDTLASNLVLIIPKATLYHFGVLSSLLHMTWVRYVCGRLESRYRYSKDIVYNNFPWPADTSDASRKKVQIAAQNVLGVRASYAGASLADLYDPNSMPADLVSAHHELDRAVDDCYGRRFADKEERMEFLFDLYKRYTDSAGSEAAVREQEYKMAA
jgi:hypothetical protein